MGMNPEDWVHVDRATQVVLENGWLTPEEIADYIEYLHTQIKLFRKLRRALEKKGFMLRVLPKNPSECER